jgi:hypothetical protein
MSLSNVTLAASDRSGLHGLMAAFALVMECVFERKNAVAGFLFMAGIARLPLTAPVVQVCVKIMMTPGAVQFVLGVKLVVELDQRPLVLSDFRMIEHDGIFLGMSQRDENGEGKHSQQKYYVFHQKSFQLRSFSKFIIRCAQP